VLASLRSLAEDPEFFLEPPEGSERIADERFCLVIGSERRWAGICRLRLPDEPSAISGVVDEILSLVHGIKAVVWNVGSSAEPDDLPKRLRALGLRAPDPPLNAVVSAMALAEAPAPADGVEVRRIETLDDHLIGLEIMLAADTWSADAVATERARAEVTFERRMRRGGMQWLASVDGAPVAWASAERAAVGLYLAGGATAPEARGRGCYRALVQARWDEAVRLGIPGLAVQAQYGSSAPILRKLGFAEVATIHTLQS
jgi:GNAT superfamily N-acetyltransferase